MALEIHNHVFDISIAALVVMMNESHATSLSSSPAQCGLFLGNLITVGDA